MSRALIGLCVLLAVGCDDGSMPEDAGPPASDAGPMTMSDAGPGERMCTPSPLPPITTPMCSVMTRTCTESCTDAECLDTCFRADPNPQCLTCTQIALISCLNRNGDCDNLWGCFRECATMNCGGAPDVDACITANCLEEDNAYFACTEAVPPATCATRYEDCLQEM